MRGRRVRTPELARLLRCFAAANLGLTVVVVVTGVVSGLLLPAFALATGAVIGAASAGDSVAVPMGAVVAD